MNNPLRNLALLGSSLTSLLMILIGGMLPSAILGLSENFSFHIVDLPSSWQIPALLLSGMVYGPSSGIIAVFAYLTIGLFYLPVFHGGGSIGYIATPDFGYLVGFIPAVWITGRIVQTAKRKTLLALFISAVCGLTIIHSIGIINIIFGSLVSRWQQGVVELLLTYSISTFPIQILLCPAIVLIAKSLRKIQLLE
ncbi:MULTISPECIES: biotin transporter BioY [Prochlorococcus]|uniref:Biotin transporter n=2 Tax=Prochlorococcus marinus TaxID=1219 RepID=Q7VBR1_PROMA|nr:MULTISPECIES: biotin transporter BioY [Prochlorococcus]AAQ00076.1 Uncharacterized BioY family conserved membrane protein [Prochlorococcus marinus subsp. marinus str. CCMP1375]KGG36373.1 Substrate-specific component BioY of biotin ECF transporter [Prochlorococcus sp. SS52]